MANEVDSAKKLLSQIISVCNNYSFKRVEIYVIFDNTCIDGTIDVITEMSNSNKIIKVIWAPDNTCVVDAYISGYKTALKNNNDWILEMDAGFSHNPKEIPKFFLEMIKGRDCVFGIRFGGKNSKFRGQYFHRLISQGGTYIINFLLNTKLKDMTSGFEIFSHEALLFILNKGIYSRGPFFQSEIRRHGHLLSYTTVPIKYSFSSRPLNSKELFDAFKQLSRLFFKGN